MQLHMNVGTLDAIKEQYDDPSHCLRETLKTWLRTCPSPTWKNIVDALRSSTIGEVRLAANLEQMHCSTQDTANYHHALPAPSSQADTQTTSPQQSQSQSHIPPAPSSQALVWTTPPTQYTIPPTQPPVLAYSESPPSHLPPWSVPYYYYPHTDYPFSTPFPLTPLTSGVVTASVHPSYSLLPQVTSTSFRPFLPSVSPLPTTPQLPATLPQYQSPPSLTTIPPDTSPILPSATITTPPDFSPPITAHTLGMTAEISIFCTVFHLKSMVLYRYIATCTSCSTTWL